MNIRRVSGLVVVLVLLALVEPVVHLQTGRPAYRDAGAYQDRIVLWVKHRFSMPQEITLRYAQIAGVNVGPGISYATLSIETTGGAVHKIKGVPKEDAWQINDLITERL